MLNHLRYGRLKVLFDHKCFSSCFSCRSGWLCTLPAALSSFRTQIQRSHTITAACSSTHSKYELDVCWFDQWIYWQKTIYKYAFCSASSLKMLIESCHTQFFSTNTSTQEQTWQHCLRITASVCSPASDLHWNTHANYPQVTIKYIQHPYCTKSNFFSLSFNNIYMKESPECWVISFIWLPACASLTIPLLINTVPQM